MNLVLHLGVGSFHRAHQAVYLHHLALLGDTRWSIVGGNIRADMTTSETALIAQHGQYTVETISPIGEHAYERIQSIRRVIAYEPNLSEIIEVGADPKTLVISFTVTEAGYYLDAASRLDVRYPELRNDLEGRTRQTIYGALAAILGERMNRAGPPVTLLNCDNLRSNGDRFRAGLLDFLERRGEVALREWIEANTTCPNAMVDRITPRPSPEVAVRVHAATGWNDAVPVMAEHFTQWVIEDRFCNARPDWERVGAQIVDAVHPFEEAKIRLLNATHSCIAWGGTLVGFNYIHEGVKDPRILQIAYEYVTEDAIPCLTLPGKPSPVDLLAYRDVVLERFSNPDLRDTNQRVAMDGFSKIPGFIVPTFKDRLAVGASIEKVALVAALFFLFLARWHRGGLPYAYQDQGMDAAVAHRFFEAPDPLLVFCENPVLWGPLASDARLVAAIRRALPRALALDPGSGHD